VNKLILFEDEHLLAVNKPSGINTHKPDRFAQDGIYEWLCKRGSELHSQHNSEVAIGNRSPNAVVAVENRSHRTLSILHRLDKDTSGVMIFGKSALANQSLAKQFESHRVKKTYLLLAAVRPPMEKFRADSDGAVTEFELAKRHEKFFLIAARPITGKTHQVRRHAAENGFPIVGDAQYGGIAAPRLMLHAQRIAFEHPESGKQITIEAPMPKALGELDALAAAKEFRELLFDERTDAFRLVSGAADGFPDVIVDFYAGKLLVQWLSEEAAEQRERLFDWLRANLKSTGGDANAGISIYEQFVTKQRKTRPMRCSCRGEEAGEDFSRRGNRLLTSAATEAEMPREGRRTTVWENGLRFLVSFGEGFSTGLFADQRENRLRLMRMSLAGKTVLNCFAYTCAFSVAAAKAGATVTSLDLSKPYLEWGKENFRVNDLNPDAHDFIFGDVFSWLKRFGKRGRKWDVVLLDPPTFSTTKEGRVFRAAKDYRELAELAMPLVTGGGVLFCSTNQRALSAEKFERVLRDAAKACGRDVTAMEFETQPFDFRVAHGEKPYLQSFWMRLL
jgi:23S rRNA (cytosine1962-C5)-methyltransferase